MDTYTKAVDALHKAKNVGKMMGGKMLSGMKGLKMDPTQMVKEMSGAAMGGASKALRLREGAVKGALRGALIGGAGRAIGMAGKKVKEMVAPKPLKGQKESIKSKVSKRNELIQHMIEQTK